MDALPAELLKAVLALVLDFYPALVLTCKRWQRLANELPRGRHYASIAVAGRHPSLLVWYNSWARLNYRTLFIMAAGKGSVVCLEKIHRCISPADRDAVQGLAAFDAAVNGRVACLEKIRGWDDSATLNACYCILATLAADGGHVACMKKLHAWAAEVEYRANDHELFASAVHGGHLACMEKARSWILAAGHNIHHGSAISRAADADSIAGMKLVHGWALAGGHFIDYNLVLYHLSLPAWRTRPTDSLHIHIKMVREWAFAAGQGLISDESLNDYGDNIGYLNYMKALD